MGLAVTQTPMKDHQLTLVRRRRLLHDFKHSNPVLIFDQLIVTLIGTITLVQSRSRSNDNEGVFSTP